jgi:dTDP-4-amino-4,6-dideoxygalactose transaminase
MVGRKGSRALDGHLGRLLSSSNWHYARVRGHSQPPQAMPSEPYLVFGAPSIGECEIAEVVQSLRSGWIGTGPKVARFERMLADYLGAEHTVAVSSCTAALHLSLVASGIGPGDEVISTAMTFASTISSIVHCGATPVLVDCDRATQLIDTSAIEAAITSRTRAILPVHFAGYPCDVDAIAALASKHELLLIEDAAHALEAEWRGRKIGTVGDATCFSFYVTKNITTGEGGLIATGDADLERRIRAYALHGMSRDAWQRFSEEGPGRYEIVVPGFKYNMTDVQAAIGMHQLPHVNAWLRRREEIWRRYDDAFAGLAIRTPAPPPRDSVHARHLYTVMVDEAECGISRDEFRSALHEHGIGTGVHYVGVHLQPYYRERFGWRPADFPHATWISERTVSLPLTPHLSDRDLDRVVGAVHDVLASASHLAERAT